MTSAEIIERLTMAMEGSRELDALVAEKLGWQTTDPPAPSSGVSFGRGWISPQGTFYGAAVPAFTTSLDAITAEIKARGGEWTVKEFNNRPPFVQAWMPGMGAEGKGITPPIALCAALLLAIA